MKKQYIASTPNAEKVADTGTNELWVKTTGNGLEQLAEKLPTAAKTNIRSREDLTVPTPWSSVVSFDILLESAARAHLAAIAGEVVINYGAVQEQAETDWRVLITLIALRKVRNIPITFKTIDIANSQDSFCIEISKHLPTKSIFSDTQAAWGKITLILLEGEVIGMLTPTNLVCSRYYYSNDRQNVHLDSTPKAVAWLANNGLLDLNPNTGFYEFVNPINNYIIQDKNYTSQPESVEYICAWLDKVKSIIVTSPFTGKGTAIDTIIDCFVNDIRNSYGQTINIPQLKSIVPADAIHTPDELITNIQGQHSLMGMLTAIAYSNLSDYEIIYEAIDQESPYRKYFNAAIFNGPSVSAVVLVKKDRFGNMVGQPYCLGALSSNYLLTVSNNIGKSDVLIEQGLMNEGAEYLNPVDFAIENAERYVYISEWMVKISAALAAFSPSAATAQLCTEIGMFVAGITTMFNAKYPAGTNEAIKAANYKNNGFVKITAGTGSVDLIFKDVRVDIDTITTAISDHVTIINTNEMVFSKESIGQELMSLYLKQQSGIGNITITRPTEKTIFDTSSIFSEKIYYVEMDDQSFTRGKYRFGSDCDWKITKKDIVGSDHYTVLWPINSKALQRLSSDNILYNLSYKYNEEKDICTVYLTCKLAGGAESKVHKDYTGPFNTAMADHGIIDQNDIPGFSVWPHVKGNNWYSVYKSEFLEQGKRTCDAALMPADSNESSEEWNQISNNEFGRQIIYRTKLPEYAEIHDSVGNALGWIRFEAPTTDISALIAANNTMSVGLDFGTSSTAVYAKIGSGAPQKVDFSTIGAYTPVKHANDDMNIYFIPDTYNNKNFYPSILRLSSNRTDSSRMLDLGNIVYKYEYEKDSPIAGNSKTESELKWDATNNKKVYLTQLIMQVIMWGKLNGVSKINWHASYPSAFSKNMKFNYKNLLNEVIASGSSSLGVTYVDNIGVNIPSNGEIVSLETESIASASYLMHGHAAANMIVIDIGGGSTDISLWDNGPTAKVQSSFNIASRKIFLEPLVEFISANKTMQNHIADITVGNAGKKPYAEIGNYIDNKETSKLNRLIEQALLNHSGEIQDKMHAISPQDPDRRRFERKIISGFFAIVYFTIEAVKSGLKDLKVKVDISLVGNGAKLYNWILMGYMNNINEYIRNRVAEITGLPNFTAITPVNDMTAKTEAAQGLLMKSSNAGALVGPSVLAGIDMSVRYKKNGVEQEPYKISENEFFFDAESDPDTDIVKLCLEGTEYKADHCDVDMASIEKHYNKFMGLVANDIFKGAFTVPPLDQIAIKTNVDGLMNNAFQYGLIQSPLFCVLVSAIDMIS